MVIIARVRQDLAGDCYRIDSYCFDTGKRGSDRLMSYSVWYTSNGDAVSCSNFMPVITAARPICTRFLEVMGNHAHAGNLVDIYEVEDC